MFDSMLKLTEISLFLPQLPSNLENTRILHVTDLHTKGYGGREQCLHDVVREGCDLFICTGDTCSELRLANPLAKGPKDDSGNQAKLSWHGVLIPPRIDDAIDVCRKILVDLDCPLPPFFMQGNHDPDEFITLLRDLGACVLANETRQIEMLHLGRINLCAAGRYQRDGADVPQTLLNLDPDLFTVGLCHYPEMAEALAMAGVDFIMAGHTHGGQVCLPGGFPMLTHSRTGRRYCAGLERIGDSFLYTSRGVGTSIAGLRLFCPPEITRFNLRRGGAENTRVTVKSL